MTSLMNLVLLSCYCWGLPLPICLCYMMLPRFLLVARSLTTGMILISQSIPRNFMTEFTNARLCLLAIVVRFPKLGVLLNAESTSRVSSFTTSLVPMLSDRWRIFYSALSVCACALVLSEISHVLSKINMATSDSVLSVQPCGCSPKQIIWWQTESG